MRYVTTITIIHEAADGKQAVEDAEALIDAIKKHGRAASVDKPLEHVTRYNTQVVQTSSETTQRRNSTVGK